MAEEDSGLEGLGDLALHSILSKLGPEDAVRASSVSKRLKLSASDDSLWSKFCFDDLDLVSPQDQHGNPLPSFKVAYQHWRTSFCMYPWSLVKRVKRCWGNLKSWLSDNFPEAEATLRRGATESDIAQLETFLKVKLPLPTRVLYRFHDGQEFSRKVNTLGIIGGYSFYRHLVNVYLLPINQIVVATKDIMGQLGIFSKSKRVLVAASATSGEKLFFLDCNSGQLYVGTGNLPTNGEMIPCVPGALIESVNHPNGGYQQDAMLLWLEEHARRLHNGVIKLRSEGDLRGISLFPEAPPRCSTSVTNGVKVRASAVFVPELADLENVSEKYTFAYSIRMSLLPEGCIINGLTYSSCQLYSRHWVIRACETIVSEVNAEAVIGKFPLLIPGGEEFVYESCSSLQSDTGSIEGSFTFFPGRLSEPKGDHFKVQVARFPLEKPDYVY